MKIEIIYSRDDGGWYAEVVHRDTGKTLYTTAICTTRVEAIEEARVWMRRQ